MVNNNLPLGRSLLFNVFLQQLDEFADVVGYYEWLCESGLDNVDCYHNSNLYMRYVELSKLGNLPCAKVVYDELQSKSVYDNVVNDNYQSDDYTELGQDERLSRLGYSTEDDVDLTFWGVGDTALYEIYYTRVTVLRRLVLVEQSRDLFRLLKGAFHGDEQLVSELVVLMKTCKEVNDLLQELRQLHGDNAKDFDLFEFIRYIDSKGGSESVIA